MIHKIPYPASTLKRAFRYYTKGFRLCFGEMKKLVEAIQEMPKEVIDNNKNIEQDVLSNDIANNNFFAGID
jgi:hypothetical protein